MVEPTPSSAAVVAAVARAAQHRRTVTGADPTFAHVSPAALEERVVALPGRPEPAAGGWWRVGLVVDELIGDELPVWLHPATGRVRTQRPARRRPPTRRSRWRWPPRSTPRRRPAVGFRGATAVAPRA